MSLWSMKKDPDLESALSRNRRWIVNNQIKNIILRCPNQVASVKLLQKKFKTLDLQGKALNWLKKYPCCFDVYLENDELYCQLTKRMMFLVEEEESVKDMQEGVYVERLAKLLMLSVNQRLSVLKLNVLRRNFGLPDDYIIRIIPKFPELFRVVNYSGRRSSMEIELLSWNPKLAISAIETSSERQGMVPSYSCSLPSSWVKSWERFHEFNSTPYISPYSDTGGLVEGSKEMDKRTVGLVHEILSLTLWKKISIIKLGHFKREFCLPEKLNGLLLKHPVVKDKFGELMQEGLHEYNRRHYFQNLEKNRKKGIIPVKPEKRIEKISEMTEQNDQGASGEYKKIGEIFYHCYVLLATLELGTWALL
ncbi:hypothetical protein ACET3Z_017121 [Daucus carota]